MDVAEGLKGVRTFTEGIADTSTLIYLERSGLLEIIVETFVINVIPQVVQEYGQSPAGCVLLPDVPAGTTDTVVLGMAVAKGVPLLSEDRRLLKAAGRLHHPYYNSFMLLLALLAQGSVTISAYHRYRDRLLSHAWYNEAVITFADRIFFELSQSLRPFDG